MYPFKLLFLAAAPLALTGCLGDILGSRDYDDRYIGYQPGYQQPAYAQPGQPYSQGGHDLQNNQNQYASTQFPTTGHWEWGTSPDGRRTRIWIPDNSYKLPAESYGNHLHPWTPPRYNQPYSNARGRYDTIRYLDGRLEHEWRDNEPSSPAQGYWQIVNSAHGLQRTWIPSVVNTASDR
jgi:hypothetical protein